jgi:anaphase-promoting complex subunit 5
MSRFLTPSKICILLLVQLYRDGSVPSKSTIPLLSFISKHTIHRSPLNTSNQTPLTPPSIEGFEALLGSHQSAVPGRSLYHLFADHLWAIHDFVTFTAFLQDQTSVTASLQEQTESSKAKFACSPTSPIGQFARRCYLESVRLQFSDAYQLWEDLVVFRESTKDNYVERNPRSPYASYYPDAASANLLQPDQFDASVILLDRMNKQDGRPAVPSSLDDVEKVMHFQLGQLQKFGSRVSDEMKSQLRAMVEQGGSKPSDMHFIKYVILQIQAFFNLLTRSVSSMLGEAVHTTRLSSFSIATSITPWRVRVQTTSRHTTSMLCSILLFSMQTSDAMVKPYLP